LIRLSLRCRAEQAEQVLAELVELAPSGVEEVRDPDGRAGVVEYAIYGAEGELPDLGALDARAGGSVIDVVSRQVPDDWAERWERFYFPVLVAGRIYVRPPWEEPPMRGNVAEVVIDPGRAFGTGTHATTRMCLELLLEARTASCRRASEPALARAVGRAIGRGRPGSFADLGCGSGLLAIAACKLDFEPVLAVDADRTALSETARNARQNGVEFAIQSLDLREAPAPTADVVAANLTSGLLEAVANNWSVAGKRPGVLIASGLLRDEADRVAEGFATAGLAERRRLASGEWGALMMSGDA
jgi:ribosomal protein L11 methyltransferase